MYHACQCPWQKWLIQFLITKHDTSTQACLNYIPEVVAAWCQYNPMCTEALSIYHQSDIKEQLFAAQLVETRQHQSTVTVWLEVEVGGSFPLDVTHCVVIKPETRKKMDMYIHVLAKTLKSFKFCRILWYFICHSE